MARRRPAGSRRRGGDGIPTARTPGARLAVAAAALLVAAALGAYAPLTAERLGGVLVPPAAAGLALLAAGLIVGAAWAVPWALVLLAGAYTGSLFLPEGAGIDGRAPLVAAGLVTAAELSYWALERRAPTVDEPGVATRHGLIAAGAAGVALVSASLVLAATAVPIGGSVLWDAVGVAAAVAALALVAQLARRSGS